MFSIISFSVKNIKRIIIILQLHVKESLTRLIGKQIFELILIDGVALFYVGFILNATFQGNLL